MTFSIAIVTFQRTKKLEQCLQSLKEALGEKSDELEKILIFINGEDRETKEWLEGQVVLRFSPEIISSPFSVTPAQARNEMIDRALGEYLLFIDDDIIFPEDYFQKVFRILENNPETDVLGGPDGQPEPPANLTQKIFSLAIESWDVTGPTTYRHLGDTIEEVKVGSEMNLILCHLWFRTNLLQSEGFRFDPDFLRNEENDLLFRLETCHKKILYAPALHVDHQRKSSLEGIVKSYWTSGRCRLRCFFKRWEWHHSLYSFPLLVLLVAFAVAQWRGLFYLFIVYLFVNFLSSLSTIWKLWESPEKRVELPRDFFFLMGMKILILSSYFSGQVFQLFHLPSWKGSEKS